MTFNLSIPAQLMGALGPDIVLMVGAMVLMLVAAWKPESAAHQRAVGFGTQRSGGQAVCQIVIFPGVRVAYWDDVFEDSDDAPPPASKSTRKSGKQKRR